jgi:two-component system OmpR family sensor kinase
MSESEQPAPESPRRVSPAPARTATLGSKHSLRGRLLWFVLVAIFMVAVLQAFTAYRGALQQADAMFDDHLQQVARSMRSGAPQGLPLAEDPDAADYDLYVQIWGQDGTQLFRSNRSALPPRAVLGFSDVEANGSRYRVYSLQTPLHTVQIAQDLSARAARAQTLALRAIWPFALLTPLLMLAVWWVINRSLAPLERARKQVARRAADDFSPLATGDLPDEVRPLVDELNLLFGRVRDAFEAQKNFVADAAHELRSPLTALKLQAQALRKSDTSPDMREAGVARLNQGIDRAIRLVEQLLTLAREEAGTGHSAPSGELLDLREVIRLAVSDVLAPATLKGIDLGLTDEGAGTAIWVQGQKEALRMMLRNLLDNAVKYTPDQGRVDVSVTPETASDGSDFYRLCVEDSGPGILPDDRGRVFDRFFRASHVAAQPGSGLGLAIVGIIAGRHSATIDLGTSARLGGLEVNVHFPLQKHLPATTKGA